MRVISTNTLRQCWIQYPDSEQGLKAWIQEVRQANWSSPQELKLQFGHASILSGKRVVFNVCGNKYRLIVDIEFRLQIIFIVWFGSHGQYDSINAKTISYVKTN